MTDTTPDQGDERRAMTAAYLAFCADKAPDHNEVGFPYFKAAWQARAYQPVAQPVVDQEPASMSDNGSCGSQVSGKPVSAEASKGVEGPPPGAMELLTTGSGGNSSGAMRQGGIAGGAFSCYLQRDHGKAPCDHDCGKLRCMHPSESVAVSEEDWHEPRQLIAGARERANMVATEGSEAWLAEFTRAVLALAAPMPQPEPTSKGEAIDWNEERQTDQSVTKPFTEWLARPGQHCQGVGANEAWNAGVAWATSQQREPQEAAEAKLVRYELALEQIANIDGYCGMADEIARAALEAKE